MYTAHATAETISGLPAEGWDMAQRLSARERATVTASQVRMLWLSPSLICGGRANQWAIPNLEAWKETSR
jgi:hypothetical protein